LPPSTVFEIFAMVSADRYAGLGRPASRYRFHAKGAALLLYPGGLERVAAVSKALTTDDASVTQCPKVSDPNLEVGGACLTAARHPKEDKYPVVLFPAPLDLNVQVLEHLGSVHEESNDVVAAADRALENSAVWNPFRVRIGEFDGTRRIARIHRLVEPLYGFETGLRHRAASIADGGPRRPYVRAAPLRGKRQRSGAPSQKAGSARMGGARLERATSCL